MRWFKHISLAHDDETMSELMDQFGAEGYGVWWIVLEKIAHVMDETDRSFARYSVKVWASFARVSTKKFQNIIKFLEKNKTFSTEIDKEYLTINCPKLLKYRDEYTKKVRNKDTKAPDKLRSESGQTPSQDTDTESDTDSNTDLDLLLNLSDDKLRVVGDNSPTTNGNIVSIKKNEKEVNDEKNKSTKSGQIASSRGDRNSGNVVVAEEVLESSESLKIKNTTPACPHEEIIALYHEMLPTCKRILLWTESRKANLRQRWREYPEMNLWRQYFEIVARSKFLTGQTTNKDGRTFVACLDWLIKPANFAKVLERRYE
jgi:hypothetical protein